MSMNENSALIEHELGLVDEALAASAVLAADPAERRLQELALALRADAERPDPEFAARLSQRVEEGFPPDPWSARGRVVAVAGEVRKVRTARPKRPSTGVLQGLGVIGSVAAVLIVIVAIGGGSSSLDDSGGGSGGGGGGGGSAAGGAAPATEQAAPPGGGGGGGGATVLPKDGEALSTGGSPLTPPTQGRFRPGHTQRIERSAALTLAAPSDKLDRVADQVISVTDRYGGFVLRSSVTSGDDGDPGGQFELRIPASKLRDALRDLSALGTVRSRNQAGQDVTAGFVTATDRLQAARAERKGLLDRLEQATTDTQVDAIRQRLDIVAAEINRLRGQLRNLRLRTNYAAVSVTLEADEDGGASGGSGGAGNIDDAVDDALGSLAGAMGIGVRALGFAIPLGLVALIVWLATRAYRRRLRESALA
jgi:Domain of unknown function (DUF4349)